MWKSHHCPSCHRQLYSRSRARCGWCGEILPEECRMDEDAVAAMKEEIRAIENRRALSKVEDEKRRAFEGDGGVAFPGI